MGLMATFMAAVCAASKRGGAALRAFAEKATTKFKAVKEKLRRYRLFAKSKEARRKLLTEMASLVDTTQTQLGHALQAASAATQQVAKYGKVAADKIINLHIPELYST